MNRTELLFQIGIGRKVAVSTSTRGTVIGKLIGVTRNELSVEGEFGETIPLSFEQIDDIRFIDEVFVGKNLSDTVMSTRKGCNALSAAMPLNIADCYANELMQGAQICNKSDPIGNRLAEVLEDINTIKKRTLSAEEAETLSDFAKEAFRSNPALSKVIPFAAAYAGSLYSKCMAIASEDLSETNADSHLWMGLASLFLGRSEGLFLFWMAKYFKEKPEAVLDESSGMGISILWSFTLDAAFGLNHYEGIREIIQNLDSLGGEYSLAAARSLIRLFQQNGNFSLAREAAATFTADYSSGIPRKARDLASLLYTDRDGYCTFAALAAERILEERRWQPATYALNDFRLGFMFDYANGRHYGRILGYDLLTYFLPTEAIPDERKKLITRGFDLSQYHQDRKLLEPFLFRASDAGRRTTYFVKELL